MTHQDPSGQHIHEDPTAADSDRWLREDPAPADYRAPRLAGAMPSDDAAAAAPASASDGAGLEKIRALASAKDPVPVLNSHPGQLDERLGVTYLEASRDRVVARMPVEGNRQPMGLLHGGSTIALCESVASIGAFLHGAELGKAAVGVDVNATHHKSATSGFVTATATPIRMGKTATSHEVVVVDDAGERVCTARITCFLK